MSEYCAVSLDVWRSRDDWTSGRLVLAALAAAAEAVTVRTVAGWTGLGAGAVLEWCQLLLDPFLTVTDDRRYAIRDAGFRQVVADEAFDGRIADYYLDVFGGFDTGLPALAADPGRAGVDHGYPLRHLTTHLARAGRWDDLRRLLLASTGGPAPANVWFDAHDTGDSIDGYLQDVDRARRQAGECTDTALAVGEPAPSLAEEIQYGLLTASVLRSTGFVPAVLVEQLVAAGLWRPARAVAHADRMNVPHLRADLLTRLLPYLEPVERPAVVERIIAGLAESGGSDQAAHYVAAVAHLPAERLGPLLAAAQAIRTPGYRLAAVAGLAAYLAEPTRCGAVGEALEAALGDRHDWVLAGALASAAPYLSVGQLRRAVTAACAIDAEEYRVQALAGLAAHLPGPEHAETVRAAFTVADAISAGPARARAMSYLAGERLDEALAAVLVCPQAHALERLVPHLRDDQIDMVLAAMLTTSWLDWRAPLRRLLPRLSPAQLDVVLAAVDAIGETSVRSELHGIVAARLPQQRVMPMLDAAATIFQVEVRRNALTYLAPSLPVPSRREVLTHAYTLASTIGSDRDKARALSAVAPHLQEPHRAAALGAAAEAICMCGHPGDGLGILPLLSEQVRQKVLARALDQAAAAAAREYGDVDWLVRLAPYLSAEQLATVLSAAAAGGERPRAQTLSGLATFLPPRLLPTAVAVADSLQDANLRATALTVLAPCLPANGRAAVLDRALAAADSIEQVTDRIKRQAALLPLLPADRRTTILDRATQLALGLEHLDKCVAAVARLAPHLPPDRRDPAITAVTARVTAVRAPAHALIRMAAWLPADQTRLAIAALGDIHPAERRARVFFEAARYVPAALLPAAVAIANGTRNQFWRAQMLALLADRLPADLLSTVTTDVNQEYFPAAAFGRRAQQLIDADPTPEAVRLGVKVLRRALSCHSREQPLAAIEALAPTIASVGGPQAPQRVLDAITHAHRWWP